MITAGTTAPLSRRKLLCLDFDGVLHSYSSGWKGARCIPDWPVDGAIDFLLLAVEKFDIAIHSSRSRYWGGRRAMKNWLRHHICQFYWTGNDLDVSSLYTASDYEQLYVLKADLVIGQISFPLWKPPAHVTIDDRAITFNGQWPPLTEIESFKPWNRKEGR